MVVCFGWLFVGLGWVVIWGFRSFNGMVCYYRLFSVVGLGLVLNLLGLDLFWVWFCCWAWLVGCFCCVW